MSISTGEAMQLWRRQVGFRTRVAEARAPRPFAVIGCRVHGPTAGASLVELRRLTLVAVYDAHSDSGKLTTRVVGVGGAVERGEPRFGGTTLSRFDKDLRLAPTAGGRGAHFDAADGELLEFVLGLERHLQRCSLHPHSPRRRAPRLPLFVAGEGMSEGKEFADLASIPKRQVLAFETPRNLEGRVGSTTFDFFHTRFRAAD